jgi:RNA polymerase sigma-70 factor (sigma-E family)
MGITLTGAPPTVGKRSMIVHDRSALEPVYLAHRQSLTRTAALLVDDVSQAEDIVQEAFLRAYVAWHRIEDPQKSLAYLRRTVVNLCHSALRRRVVARRHPPAAAVDRASAEDDALHAMERSSVVQALRLLSRRHREAVVLRFYLGLSESAAAAAMDVSVGSVKAYASRGMAQLQQLMEQP